MNLAVIQTPAEIAALPDVALSIRQPWAWAILNAGKDIENRVWRTKQRGPIAIHASKGMTFAEYRDCLDTMAAIRPDLDLPGIDELQRGGIVATATIADCVYTSDSPWFFGNFGFVLQDVRPVPFIPVMGERGFFKWKRHL